MKQLKAFDAWLVRDEFGTYADAIFLRRQDARDEIRAHIWFLDAKWRLIRVRVQPRKAKR